MCCTRVTENIPVNCDPEECLREVVHSTAGKLELPTGVTAVEQIHANGRVEQRVRALGERLQILVGDARRRGVDFPRSPCCSVGEWVQHFLVKRDVDLQDGGTVKTSPHVAHTGDQAPNNVVVGFLERVLVRSKVTDDKQPRFWKCWALGYKDADIITLM